MGQGRGSRGPGRRPKVLLAMEPLVGGTLRHLEYILRLTDPGEFDLHLAVSAGRDPSVRSRFEQWRERGFVVNEVPMCRAPNPAVDPAALQRLWRLCRRERYDLVHTHSSKAGFLGRFAGRATGARTVHTPHVLPFGRGGSRIAEAAYLALERLAARWTDRMVLLTAWQRDLVRRTRLLAAGKTVLIPNGIVPGDFAGPGRAAARRALGLGPDAFVVLTPGRLCRQKGQDVLLRAAGRVCGQVPDLRIVLLGDGPDRGRLQKLAASLGLGDAVTFAPTTPDVATHYAACDLVALPSRFEGAPYVVLEAKAARRAVAVSRACGSDELVNAGVDGFVAEANAGDAWAALLASARKDRGLLAAMGERGAAGIRREWLAEESVGRLHGLYRELLGA